MRERITSRANPLMTHIRKLASSRAYRQSSGAYMGDGAKLLEEAELWGFGIKTLLYTQGVELPPFDDRGTRIIQVTESVMESVSPMKTPQGVVFTCMSMSHRTTG